MSFSKLHICFKFTLKLEELGSLLLKLENCKGMAENRAEVQQTTENSFCNLFSLFI